MPLLDGLASCLKSRKSFRWPRCGSRRYRIRMQGDGKDLESKFDASSKPVNARPSRRLETSSWYARESRLPVRSSLEGRQTGRHGRQAVTTNGTLQLWILWGSRSRSCLDFGDEFSDRLLILSAHVRELDTCRVLLSRPLCRLPPVTPRKRATGMPVALHPWAASSHFHLHPALAEVPGHSRNARSPTWQTTSVWSGTRAFRRRFSPFHHTRSGTICSLLSIDGLLQEESCSNRKYLLHGVSLIPAGHDDNGADLSGRLANTRRKIEAAQVGHFQVQKIPSNFS